MLIRANWMPNPMLLPEICHTCSKTFPLFTRIFR